MKYSHHQTKYMGK